VNGLSLAHYLNDMRADGGWPAAVLTALGTIRRRQPARHRTRHAAVGVDAHGAFVARVEDFVSGE